MPEPTTVQLEGNKTDVYERQQARREKDRRMQSLSDLAGRLLEGKGQTDSVSGPDGSIRQSADTYERITEQLETFYETPQETAGGLEQKVDELNRRLEEAEAENRRAESRERMMEQSYRMAARYLNPKPEATPGETEEEFSQTLAFLRRCGFAQMHIFPYSIRPGTRAAEMEQVPGPVKEERAARASAVAAELHRAYLQGCVGQTYPVLFEQRKDGCAAGHAPNYMPVEVQTQEDYHNTVRHVKITGVVNDILMGEVT